MDWNAIGAVGEILGALAVVATLFYLTRQLKQNSQQIRLSSSQVASNTYSGRMREVLMDPDLLRVFRHGLHDYASLPPDDQATFHGLMMGFQVSYFHNAQLREEGVISDETFLQWQDDWIRILKCHGAQQWWQWVQNMIDADASAAIDRLVSESDQTPLYDAVPFLRVDG